jgi:putative membrane protein
VPHLHHSISGLVGSAWLTVTIGLTALLYAVAWVRLRSNSSSCTPPWRACSSLAGVFVIWLAVASPFASLDHQLLTAHMLKHLLLMTIAPPLIWLGKPVSTLLHGLPLRRPQRALGRGFQLQPVIIRIASVLGRPRFCWSAASAALIGWHIPSVFAVGMQSPAWHFVEEGSFLVAGLLFWWPVVQPWRARPRAIVTADLSIVLYLFLATLPCDILSGFLVFCDRVVYPVYLSSSHLFGFSPLGDQQCAAALMWTCVTVVYLVAGAILTFRLLCQQAGLEYKPSGSALHGVARRNVQSSLEAF